MKILCIDTATESGLVAVACDDRTRASVRWRSAGRHGENLLGYIESALSDASVSRGDVSGIGVVTGPGGFTSLRVGLATAKGLALGLDLPIFPLSSLRVMARSIRAPEGSVRVPVMKAYRGEVFAAAYVERDGDLDELVEPRSGHPTKVLQEIRDAVGVRPISAWTEEDRVTADALVQEARFVIRTEGAADLASLEPRYLRPSDAKLPERPLRTE
ncbi:MAG: tRNA (adenosine(37)-N6)-threonylcarbamoyltransferase complex dimerization subunit type 1 TsaB [Myxococcales bacterium]|jgi:tRNA threonylcarbamoyladenosine biosynthesis protein TsaB